MNVEKMGKNLQEKQMNGCIREVEKFENKKKKLKERKENIYHG